MLVEHGCLGLSKFWVIFFIIERYCKEKESLELDQIGFRRGSEASYLPDKTICTLNEKESKENDAEKGVTFRMI